MALALHGESQALPSRPIHHCVDRSGHYALTAFNNPANITVHRINGDGTVGAQVQQTSKVDVGIYAHQVTVTPSNRLASSASSAFTSRNSSRSRSMLTMTS